MSEADRTGRGAARDGPQPWVDHEIVGLSLTLAENLPCHSSAHQPF